MNPWLCSRVRPTTTVARCLVYRILHSPWQYHPNVKGVARTLKRHYNQKAIDQARAQSRSRAAVRDRIRRRWLMKGSFANATVHHGFKRSRWRRLWRQRIQDYLIGVVQNLRLLARKSNSPIRAIMSRRLAAAFSIVKAAMLHPQSILMNE